jgi:ribosomal protein S18 acetylase RimI-like enzyme
MPRPHLVVPMSIEEFEHMEHRLGWKHEYWDDAAQLSTQETAVVSYQRPVGAAGLSWPPLREGEQLRPIRTEDEPGLAELFILAFDDAVEFTGWPDDVYREDARDNIASFFGKPPRKRHRDRRPGRPEVSFAVASGEQLLAAVLIRSLRRGPILEPIMVHPAHQRRGLGTALLSAALQALNADGATTLYSECHLGNAASLAWHEKHGFQEIPSYFAATHRWRHFAWLAEHFEYVQQPERARQMRQLAEHWEAVVEEFEKSNDRWSSGLLD